jgi:hypothetical protein
MLFKWQQWQVWSSSCWCFLLINLNNNMDETTNCPTCGNNPCTCAPAPETPEVTPETPEATPEATPAQ